VLPHRDPQPASDRPSACRFGVVDDSQLRE
jgi:hypothetical protein